ILFSNIYVGHSVEDAKKFAAETFQVKKALEKAASSVDEEEEESVVGSFTENPVAFIRQKVFTFLDVAKVDPVFAFKSQPETGTALVGVVLTFFGMIGALFGLVGSQQKPVIKVRVMSSKKTDAPTPDDKDKKEKEPVATAGGEKKDESTVKKRK
ncbi:hypothetical protein EW146_g3722, partial [Bondarzewia mesenterica]